MRKFFLLLFTVSLIFSQNIWNQKGMEKIKKGKYKLAFKYFLKGCNENLKFSINHNKMQKCTTLVKKVFQQKCNENFALACYYLGKFYNYINHINSNYNTDNYNLAIKYYKKSCDLNYGEGCLEITKLTKFNYDSIKYLQKACKLNAKNGCLQLGEIYYNGRRINERKHIFLNYKKAKFYLEKACNLNSAKGCYNLGIFYLIGPTGKENYQTAKKFLEKACKLNEIQACNNLGKIYYFGLGVKKDFNKAIKYFKYSCNKNEEESCINLGVLYINGEGVKKDYKKAIKYFKMACNDKFGQFLIEGKGCYYLGLMFEKGIGVKKNKLLSKKYYQKACNSTKLNEIDKKYCCKKIKN